MKLQHQNEKLAQYSRRNCVIIHGLEEINDENTNDLALNFFENNLGITGTNESDID